MEEPAMSTHFSKWARQATSVGCGLGVIRDTSSSLASKSCTKNSPTWSAGPRCYRPRRMPLPVALGIGKQGISHFLLLPSPLKMCSPVDMQSPYSWSFTSSQVKGLRGSLVGKLLLTNRLLEVALSKAGISSCVVKNRDTPDELTLAKL